MAHDTEIYVAVTPKYVIVWGSGGGGESHSSSGFHFPAAFTDVRNSITNRISEPVRGVPVKCLSGRKRHETHLQRLRDFLWYHICTYYCKLPQRRTAQRKGGVPRSKTEPALKMAAVCSTETLGSTYKPQGTPTQKTNIDIISLRCFSLHLWLMWELKRKGRATKRK